MKMISYNDLIKNVDEDCDVHQYLNDFFDSKNYGEYKVDDYLDFYQRNAIKIMFNSKKNIDERIDEALKCDPYCIEAFFAYLLINEDAYVQVSFDEYYSQASEYGSFSKYKKDCFIKIMELYIDFCLDIHNITRAIRIQKLIILLTNSYKREYVGKLSYMYYITENCDEFYKLYSESNFEAFEYLLLIITLLKHDENLKAKQALLDMFDKVEYSKYIDHVWDLDENDLKQKAIIKLVEECYDDICSIPTFFSWFHNIAYSAK